MHGAVLSVSVVIIITDLIGMALLITLKRFERRRLK
jgi:hypothetical protein